MGNRLADSVETAINLSDGLLIVEYENETLPKNLEKETITFSSKFSCPESGFTIEEIEPRRVDDRFGHVKNVKVLVIILMLIQTL